MAEGHNWPGPSFYLGEGNGTPLQYSCLENPMDGGACYAAIHVVAKSRTPLSDFTFTFHFHALEMDECLEHLKGLGNIKNKGIEKNLSLQ